MNPDSNSVEAVKMTVGLGVVIGILILLAANLFLRPKQRSLAKQPPPAAKNAPVNLRPPPPLPSLTDA